MSADSFQIIKATKIVSETTNAYMYSDYGEKHWLGIACFLLEQGFTEAEAIYMLRSKNMRWSRDGRDIATLDEFKYYCNKYPRVLEERRS